MLIIWEVYKNGMLSFQRFYAFAAQPLCSLTLVSPANIKHHTKVDKTCKVERKKKHEIGIQYVEEENTWAGNEK